MSSMTLSKTKIGRKLSTVLLAGALATGGIVTAQLAAAPSAQAATCGSTAQWSGYAYANNPCGYAYAEVDRYIGGKKYYVSGQVYKKGVSVTYTAGTRAYEVTARW